MKAGFAEMDTTPSVGMHANGCWMDYGERKGIQTPFSFSAAYIETETAKIAIVGADLIRMHKELPEYALPVLRKYLPLDMLICGASHTHANEPRYYNPMLSAEEIRQLEDIHPDVREKIIQASGPTDIEYRNLLCRRLVDVVVTAWQRREDVTLVAGKTQVERVSYNRRQKMKNGLTVTHAGKGNPDIVDYAGPVDKTLTALGAINKSGKMTGAVVNFACHATVDQGGKFSADWPYYMRRTVKQNINPDMPVVFLNGCCGDVTQIDNLSTEPEPRDDKRARVLGNRVGLGAVDALTDAKEFQNARVKCVSDILDIKYREIPEEKYRNALDKINKEFKPRNFEIAYYAVSTVFLKHISAKKPCVSCELNAVQIGDLLLVSFPGEIFAQMALDIRKNSPLNFTMPVSLSNNHLGYVPTPDVFGPGGGGYEGKFGGSSCLETVAFEKMRDGALAMIQRLEIPVAPASEPAQPGKPWKA